MSGKQFAKILNGLLKECFQPLEKNERTIVDVSQKTRHDIQFISKDDLNEFSCRKNAVC